jgi:hypothetical protein
MGKHGSGGSGKGSSSSGKSGGSKSGGSQMTKEDASRIQSAGARDSSSPTAQSGFDSRAQSAGDRNANAEKG